jgi:hypothetical protein
MEKWDFCAVIPKESYPAHPATKSINRILDFVGYDSYIIYNADELSVIFKSINVKLPTTSIQNLKDQILRRVKWISLNP